MNENALLVLSNELDKLLVKYIIYPSNCLKQEIELKRKEMHDLIEFIYKNQSEGNCIAKTA